MGIYINPMIALSYNPQSRFAIIADETKLMWLVCLSIIILFLAQIPAQLIILAALIILAISGEIKFGHILGYIKLFVPIVLLIFMFHLFYHDGRVLFKIWMLSATDTGMKAGLLNLLRFLNFLLITICFFSWSSPLNLATKLATCFGLAKGRFFQDLALAFFIALRFLPVLIRERETLKLAMRARGMNLQGSLKNHLQANIKIMLPLIARVIGQTDDVACAIALKGNGNIYFVPERTRLNMIDIILMIAGMILVIMVFQYEKVLL